MSTHTIRLLPDTLANQIAAGEVIQRPASVVKELIENSLDAGSKHIKVMIKDAGKTLIQVIDDGIGMSEVDARMSLEKHATSKISHPDDLFNITTMGFRGEAIPSIIAVGQVVIETRTEATELGTRLVVEGSIIKSQEPVAVAKGTVVTVKNLFFNVPARRNFLKSTPVETKHIIEEFQHIALARPDVAFSLYQNDQETYHLPATKLAQRIVHLFGENYKKQLIPCQEHTDMVQIQGYIGNPTYAKKTRGEQFFFVNKRFIKNAYLHHAIKTALDALIPKETFPFYVLFIDISPQRIDVNVHPTKVEIKFDDEQGVYAILKAAVQQALGQHVMPVLEFEQAINHTPLGLEPSLQSTQWVSAMDRNYMQFKAWGQSTGEQDWEALLQKIRSDGPEAGVTALPELTFEPASALPLQAATSVDLSESQQIFAGLTEVPVEKTAKMQLQATYILASVKSGLLLIDQQAAHERILYEKYAQDIKNNTGISQQLLFPQQMDLNQADFELLQTYKPSLAALGFAIETFGRNSIILVGYPADTTQEDPKQLLEAVLEQIKWNQVHLSLPIQESVARSLAKQASMRTGKKLLAAEMDSLVDQLFACTHTSHAPDGRRIWVILTLAMLAKFLKP